MQPSDKRAKLKKATVARCRMFRKAYLAFLPGFPVPDESSSCVEWCMPTVGLTGEFRSLTPEDIRQAVYGWSEMHKFPRVFPQTVDDAAAWHREMPTLLERLGKAVHGKERLPECLLEISTGFAKNDVRRAKILAASSLEMRELLDAASWLMLLAPGQLTPLVDWLEAEPEAVIEIMRNWPGVEGVNLVLALHRFREEDGHACWQRIIETFAAPQAKKIVTYFSWYHARWKEILLDISRQTRHPKPSKGAAPYEQESPECPEPEWLTLVYTLCEKAVALPKNERRQVLDLFTDCVPPGLLHRWGVWWQGAMPVVAQAERLLSRMRDGVQEDNRKRAEKAKNLLAAFADLQRCVPPETAHYDERTNYYLQGNQALKLIAGDENPPWKAHRRATLAMMKLVDTEHGRFLPRLAMLFGISNALDEEDDNDSSVDYALVLEEMRRWQLPQIMRLAAVRQYWGDYAGDREKLRRIGQALHCWCVEWGNRRDLNKVIAIASVVDDPARMRAFLVKLAETKFLKRHYAGEQVLKTAAALAREPENFLRVLVFLNENYHENDNLTYEDLGNLEALGFSMGDSPWLACVRETLLNRETAPVLEAAQDAIFLKKRNLAMPLPVIHGDASAAWISGYPGRFREALEMLAAFAPDAERVAARTLSQLRYVPDEIRREIANLEHRLPNVTEEPARVKIEKRLENLRRRLADGQPTALSETRLGHLHKKLTEITCRYFFRHLGDTAISVANETICGEFGLKTYPESWHEPKTRKILAGVLEIEEKGVKPLAIKLLCGLANGQPWDYANEPANLAFLDKLREQGIDPEPWLTPPEPLKRTTPNGETLTLAIETDPLAVMWMGAPFKTCLSPWRFNFFSTVANVLDVNKHVLYARDGAGTIQCRCLVALTDEGRLLAFHPYTHDKALGFKAWVAEFLEALAARMNTVVVNDGEVSSLVSPEWYDDGAIEINPRFAFLKKKSKFAKSLKTLAVAELLPTLERELAPLPVKGYILGQFLDLPAVETRPELVLPLLPLATESLPLEQASRLIKLAHEAGARSEVELLAQRIFVPHLRRIFREYAGLWKHWVEPLVPIIPQTLYTHIRNLKRSGTKKLSSHDQKIRREMLVAVLKVLGKYKKARRLERELGTGE